MPAQRGATKFASGQAPISQAQGTDVAVITDPGKGTWEIWGTVRHTLVDGCRLAIGPVASPVVQFVITAGANVAQDFGPVVVDILNSTDDIIIELQTATGGSDTASATVYARRVTSI